MIKKTTLIFLTLIALKSILHGQTDKNFVNKKKLDIKYCQFFSGDSLIGFDLNKAINEAKNQFPIYQEQKVYIFRKEIAFVKRKYKIDKLAFEILAESKTVKPTSILTSGCNNIDFSAANFTGWTGGIGYNANTHNPLTVTSAVISSIGNNALETSCSYHTLVNTGVDPYGKFPTWPNSLNGSFACRLGGEFLNIDAATYYSNFGTACATSNDPSGNGYSNGEMIQQTIPITASNCLLTYNYAVIMADAPHTASSNPYFKAEVLDSTGAIIPCLSYIVESDTTGNGGVPPGFSLATAQDELGNQVLYSNWQQRAINLKAYVDHPVTVRFTAAGCSVGGHFCYAYISGSCGPLQLNAYPAAICPGSGTVATITAPALGGIYNWSGPGIVGATKTQSIQANTVGTYTAVISSGGPCSFTQTLTYSITSTTAQLVSISGQNSICKGTTDMLTASGATNYTWSTNTGSLTTNTVNVTPTGNTTYTVTGTTGSCLGTGIISVVVNIPALININLNPGNDTICAGQPDILLAGGGSTYTWSANAGSATTNSVSVSPTINTTYSLTAKDNNGCIDTASKTIYVKICTTGINQLLSSNEHITVYPNPNNGNFTIETSKKQTVLLHDVNGRLALNQTITGKTSIDASNLAEGIYNVSLVSNEGVVNKRLVIIK